MTKKLVWSCVNLFRKLLCVIRDRFHKENYIYIIRLHWSHSVKRSDVILFNDWLNFPTGLSLDVFVKLAPDVLCRASSLSSLFLVKFKRNVVMVGEHVAGCPCMHLCIQIKSDKEMQCTQSITLVIAHYKIICPFCLLKTSLCRGYGNAWQLLVTFIIVCHFRCNLYPYYYIIAIIPINNSVLTITSCLTWG